MSNNRKLISFQVDKGILEELKRASEEDNVSQVKIFHDALRDYLDQREIVKSGGMVAIFPNPQLCGNETQETKEAVINAVEDLDFSLMKISPNLRKALGFRQIVMFLEERLLLNVEPIFKKGIFNGQD